MATKDIDRGWKRIKREIAKMDSAYVKTGIQQGTADYKGGVAATTVAMVNEFGSEDGHIPERSFLRSSFDENATQYAGMMKGFVTDIYSRDQDG